MSPRLHRPVDGARGACQAFRKRVVGQLVLEANPLGGLFAVSVDERQQQSRESRGSVEKRQRPLVVRRNTQARANVLEHHVAGFLVAAHLLHEDRAVGLGDPALLKGFDVLLSRLSIDQLHLSKDRGSAEDLHEHVCALGRAVEHAYDAADEREQMLRVLALQEDALTGVTLFDLGCFEARREAVLVEGREDFVLEEVVFELWFAHATSLGLGRQKARDLRLQLLSIKDRPRATGARTNEGRGLTEIGKTRAGL